MISLKLHPQYKLQKSGTRVLSKNGAVGDSQRYSAPGVAYDTRYAIGDPASGCLKHGHIPEVQTPEYEAT